MSNALGKIGMRCLRGTVKWNKVSYRCLLFAVFCCIVLTYLASVSAPVWLESSDVPDSFRTLSLFCFRNHSSQDYVCEPLVRTVRIPVRSSEVNDSNETTKASPALIDDESIRAISGSIGSADGRRSAAIKGATNGSLLTLFTTMKDINIRRAIHANTLLNWAALRPHVSPILFVPDSGSTAGRWSEPAARLGWRTIRTPYTVGVVPILRRMFQTVERLGYGTPFLGYANADLLFDGDLIRTLLGVLESYGGAEPVANSNDSRPILITGRRKNVNAHLVDDAACLPCIRKIASEASLYQPDAEDYFIVSRAGFPWPDVPDFVVGSPGYDNWLVAKAVLWGVDVIDASRTINAVHQVGADGVKAGFRFNRDPTFNLRLVSSNFRYERGKTTCARLKTIFTNVACPSDLGRCVKVVPAHPAEIPADCRENPVLTTESFLDQLLGHHY